VRMLATTLTVLLPLYLAIAPAYSRLQDATPVSGWAAGRFPSPEPYRPDVDVIVPCYNEEPALVAACLWSLAQQDFKLDGNRGKREAQAAALRQGSGEVVVTVDSDTTIAPDGIRDIVAWLGNPSVGAATGNLRAANADATWLTRLIDTRYRPLFERERAAQGFFGAVLCCAGPFSAYRRAAVQEVLDDYLGQQFWGGRRVFGDDLELTNLVLAAGYESVFEPTGRATTKVPTTLRRFVRQQLRWNRSFYRELPQMLRLLTGRSCYLALDLAGRTLLPPLSAVVVVATAADALVTRSAVPLGLGRWPSWRSSPSIWERRRPRRRAAGSLSATAWCSSPCCCQCASGRPAPCSGTTGAPAPEDH
jgi:N-acetylglucosaminyltransferase